MKHNKLVRSTSVLEIIARSQSATAPNYSVSTSLNRLQLMRCWKKKIAKDQNSSFWSLILSCFCLVKTLKLYLEFLIYIYSIFIYLSWFNSFILHMLLCCYLLLLALDCIIICIFYWVYTFRLSELRCIYK